MPIDEEKKKYALEDLKDIYSCAKEAGIEDAVFVGFGLLLGIVREGDFIKHDNDIDMCVRADLITPTQELNYYNYLHEKGLFFSRDHKSFRRVEKGFGINKIVPGSSNEQVRFTWFSLRKRINHLKFCHWFFFPWNGYQWHSKSGKWITPRKFDPKLWNYKRTDEAMMKGIPANYIEKLTKYKFHGIKINVPLMVGSCLDFWYPGWLIPRNGGASAKKIGCIVGDWKDKTTWKVQIR